MRNKLTVVSFPKAGPVRKYFRTGRPLCAPVTKVESYFADCPRDKLGHCLPSGQAGESAGADAKKPRIFRTPDDIKPVRDFTGQDIGYGWKDRPGLMVTGKPVPHKDLPPVLYHVTTAAPAVRQSGMLLGQRSHAGLGGGQEDGVSFTTSRNDADLIQRELLRAVGIAKGEIKIEDFPQLARADEQRGGLPPGSLDHAVSEAKRQHDTNVRPSEGADWEADNVSDAYNMYLWGRKSASQNHSPQAAEKLKNPILFSDRDKLRKIDPSHIEILEVPKENIPQGALLTTGSDDFLHELRSYSDVPVYKFLHRAQAKAFDESLHPRGQPENAGEFAPVAGAPANKLPPIGGGGGGKKPTAARGGPLADETINEHLRDARNWVSQYEPGDEINPTYIAHGLHIEEVEAELVLDRLVHERKLEHPNGNLNVYRVPREPEEEESEPDDGSEPHEKKAKAEIEPLGEDELLKIVGGPDDGAAYKEKVAKYRTQYADDKPLDAYGTWVEVDHPNLKSFKNFVGVDENGDKFIHLELIEVASGHEGEGLGTQIFADQVKNATEAGFKYIHLHAAGSPGGGMNGYYTWPRFGFDESLDQIEEDDQTIGNDMHIADIIREEFPDAESILDVMKTKKGRDWWKENGSDLYDMKFDLSKGSRSRKVFDAYLKERKKREQKPKKPKEATDKESKRMGHIFDTMGKDSRISAGGMALSANVNEDVAEAFLQSLHRVGMLEEEDGEYFKPKKPGSKSIKGTTAAGSNAADRPGGLGRGSHREGVGRNGKRNVQAQEPIANQKVTKDKESYFHDCPRDDKGHCLPSGRADTSGQGNPHKPEQQGPKEKPKPRPGRGTATSITTTGEKVEIIPAKDDLWYTYAADKFLGVYDSMFEATAAIANKVDADLGPWREINETPANESPADVASDEPMKPQEVLDTMDKVEWKRYGVHSQTFKKWFGNWDNDPEHASKVLDENGPAKQHGVKKVYHGAGSSFVAFSHDVRSSVVGRGYYFAENRDIAENFAEARSQTGVHHVVEAYLNIRNPFDFDKDVPNEVIEKLAVEAKQEQDTEFDYWDFKQRIEQNGRSGKGVWDALSDALGTEWGHESVEQVLPTEKGVNAVLFRAGFDGITHRSVDLGGTPAMNPSEEDKYGRIWIAFKPPQIKAVDNEGTFHPNDENIYKGAKRKAVAGPCKPGQTAAETGCTPAQGAGGKKPTLGREHPWGVEATDQQIHVDPARRVTGRGPVNHLTQFPLRDFTGGGIPHSTGVGVRDSQHAGPVSRLPRTGTSAFNEMRRVIADIVPGAGISLERLAQLAHVSVGDAQQFANGLVENDGWRRAGRNYYRPQKPGLSFFEGGHAKPSEAKPLKIPEGEAQDVRPYKAPPLGQKPENAVATWTDEDGVEDHAVLVEGVWKPDPKDPSKDKQVWRWESRYSLGENWFASPEEAKADAKKYAEEHHNTGHYVGSARERAMDYLNELDRDANVDEDDIVREVQGIDNKVQAQNLLEDLEAYGLLTKVGGGAYAIVREPEEDFDDDGSGEHSGVRTRGPYGEIIYRRGKQPDFPHDTGPVPNISPERKKVFDTLQSSTVDKIKPVGGGHVNGVYKVVLEDGTAGAFKPEEEERMGIRRDIHGPSWSREVAASRIAELLGLDDLVPVTVERTINGKRGSVQEWVVDGEDAVNVGADMFDGDEDAARAAAFDYLIGNSDRHARNWMMRPGGKIALTDNGLSFPRNDDAELGNARMMLYASHHDFPIPEQVNDWDYEKIKPILDNLQFGDREKEGVRKRLLEMQNVRDFNELKHQSSHYWSEGPVA